MLIAPRQNFRHCGDLPARFDSFDPRSPAFTEEEVTIDLRECSFIQPPAVLWCVVYPLLASLTGSLSELWVPTNMGTCVYLKSIALFDALRENGVKVDDRGISTSDDPHVVLPLTRFDNVSEAEELTNRANDFLRQSGRGSANIYPIVSETFAELAVNAVGHARSPIGAYGFIQFYSHEKGQRFVCGVADGGIGIRKSLEGNPAHLNRIPYDWVAIELATRERISGTLDATRGIGLFGVAEDMRKPGRQLIIHSGIGSLNISEELESRASRTRLFPGTLAYASITT